MGATPDPSHHISPNLSTEMIPLARRSLCSISGAPAEQKPSATGGTVAEAARILLKAGSCSDITVAATHGVFVQGARNRLSEEGVGTSLSPIPSKPPTTIGRKLQGCVYCNPVCRGASEKHGQRLFWNLCNEKREGGEGGAVSMHIADENRRLQLAIVVGLKSD